MASDWRQISAQALREGRSLKDAARAYRLANLHTHRNPESPESMHRHDRSRRIGELLRAGHPFREAVRMVDREFDRYQHAQRSVERAVTHPFSRANPDAGRNWLLVGGLAVGLYLLWQRGSSAPASVSQLPTLLPNPPQYGPASAPVVTVTATPGGY
jgi:hypothetical protein